MFSTFGRTWNITKICWQILQKDRELILFPVFSGVAMVFLAAIVWGVGGATGAIDRLQASQGESMALTNGDLGLFILAYFALSFVVIYFNTALVGAAMIRIRGGDPTVGDGIAIASRRLPQILGWSLIAGTVGLLLRVLREQAGNNMFGQIIISMVGGVWAYLTFFVVPTIVVEGAGPVQAIKRSSSLFKRTWGEQFVSNFGFGLLFVAAVIVGAIPAFVVAQISPVVGVAVGVVTVGGAAAIVSSLEGIFKAALYEYAAEDVVANEFSVELLKGSYRQRGAARGFI